MSARTDDVRADCSGDDGLTGVKCGGVGLQGFEAAADVAEIEMLDGGPLHGFGFRRGIYGISSQTLNRSLFFFLAICLIRS